VIRNRRAALGLVGMITIAMAVGACSSNPRTVSTPSPSTLSSVPRVVASTSSVSATSTSAVSSDTSDFGFPTGVMKITAVDGSSVSHKVWVADTEALRERGLMDVTAIPGADAGITAMAFVFDQPTDSNFYMLHTRIALTIAFVADGRVAAVTDMEPCPNDDDDPRCPRYGSPVPYALAIEVPKGAAESLGLSVGSTVSVRTA
jgi:uncharacterized membrane protein (UPF0127 family)